MADFFELIKNFDKIRDYTRDFFIYGYRHRNDFMKKSARSYDNEKRRIESYLTANIACETSARGKKFFIHTDTADISENPLFPLWETKSFTVNDCVLHFCLLDILRNHPGMTAPEIADRLYGEYLPSFADNAMPDAMTIRNKLNEYADAGICTKQKDGKYLRYDMDKATIPPLLLRELATAIHFFENALPAGILGYLIRRDNGKEPPAFSFRHIFMAHTLDDGVFIALITAISDQSLIQFENHGRRSRNKTARITAIPLKIAVHARHGRRYLLAYNIHLHKFFSYRLDYIKNVKPLENSPTFAVRRRELENRLLFAWGIAPGKQAQNERLEVTFHIDEKTEDYVLARLKREGKHGTVEKTAQNTFIYRIEITDTMEMLPWLRTFIGRIIKIDGSNRQAIKQFNDDMNRLFQLYEV